ncbi:MAG TPA: GerMN domain-containing protein [Candidatus Bathyarchaeia archaeon]|nr:GerMN domain-containing protein [Candidatus Bathyarchaeia archaeon]
MMGPAQRAEIYRRIFFAAWGLATVVLVFVAALLVFVLLRQEHAPVMPNAQAPAAAPAQDEAQFEATSTKEVNLYFADKQSLRLVAEKAPIEFTEFTTENCRRAIEALIRGPQGDLDPVISPETRIRGLYLMPDGELVIDFTLDLALQFKKTSSASFESLMIYGIVNTVAQKAIKGSREPAVTKVRLLIEGSAREAFSVHADISEPFTPDPGWASQGPV